MNTKTERILSIEQAKEHRCFAHYAGRVVQLFRFEDSEGFYCSVNDTNRILRIEAFNWLIDLGCVWTTKEGAERHLAAIQTKAELRRLANWVESDDPDEGYWSVYYIEDPWPNFYALEFCKAEWPGIGPIARFTTQEVCQAAIDKVGQEAIRNVYEMGESL